tara:strand:+ start:3226 stop:3483 length:258 start_codon:yes stop_codon:yes gene_type:complete
MTSKGFTVEDIKLVMRGKENFPLVYVKGYEDKDYQFLYRLCKDIDPKTEDNMYDVSQKIKTIITSLRYFENYDYEKLVRKIRGYC